MAANDPARDTIGERHELTRAGRQITYHTLGAGHPIVMIASLGREASDFNELAETLAASGFLTIAIAPPGLDGSAMPEGELTLHDLADDVATVVDASGITSPVTVLGHAFGNRVARCFASDYQERTHSTIVIAAGGKRPIPQRAHEALFNCFDVNLSTEKHEAEVRYGFFAGDNPIPDYWLRGWHTETAQLQGAATRNTPSDEWWHGGTAPLLVLQAMQDRIAPPEDTADLLESEFANRVTVSRIENAGHAFLPETPEAIAKAIHACLKR